MSNEQTTIRISKHTQDILSQIGRFGETYDQVIYRLLKEKERSK